MINGAQIHYELSGAGEALVLIHGNTLDLRMWAPQVEALSRRFQVLRYDLRGFGKSSLPTGPYSHAGDLMALLDHCGIRQAHVLGLSRGGLIAAEFALTYPEAVKRLILADAGINGYPWKAFAEFNAEVVQFAQTQGVDAARKHWLSSGLFAPALANEQLAPTVRKIVGDYSGWHWLHADPQRLVAPSALEQLSSIQTPTLVMVGEHEIPEFQDVVNITHQRIPNAKMVTLPGVGHLTNLEAPDAFNDHVIEFLTLRH